MFTVAATAYMVHVLTSSNLLRVLLDKSMLIRTEQSFEVVLVQVLHLCASL